MAIGQLAVISIAALAISVGGVLVILAIEHHYDKEILSLKQDINYLKEMVKWHNIEISELIREKDND
jgi:hypothetical protein